MAQIGRALRLRFRAPQLATDGRRLTKPIEVEIFRQIAALGQPVTRTFVPGKPWVDIKPDALPHFKRGQEIIYDDRLSPQQFSASVDDFFSFAVITLTRGFRGRPRESDLSNLARSEILNVSQPVERLRVVQKRKGLELQWPPPASGLSGKPLPLLAAYRIYRSQEQHAPPPAAEATTKEPFYLDRKFEFNRTYYYRVRAIFTQDGYNAETDDSNVAAVTPRDIFPPSPPAGLEAVYTGREVELIWNSAPEPNVAGYNVYREGPQRPPTRLNKGLLRTPVFADRSAAPGARYIYWVTAVDAAGNESSPSTRVTAETR